MVLAHNIRFLHGDVGLFWFRFVWFRQFGGALLPAAIVSSRLCVVLYPVSVRAIFFLMQATLVLLQPDPKASHAEVSLSLDGVSHKVKFFCMTSRVCFALYPSLT